MHTVGTEVVDSTGDLLLLSKDLFQENSTYCKNTFRREFFA